MLLLLFPLGRNILFAVLRSTNRFFKLIPGKQTIALLGRYMNIVRFANYKEQFQVYNRLTKQYPPVPISSYCRWTCAIWMPVNPSGNTSIKWLCLPPSRKTTPEVHPFVFVDPRRMEEDGERFFKYRIDNNQVVLEDCFIRTFIEDHHFAGFKIYPALGYYPFDERLLPLWKYAADNGIPIMTHCIRGVIYYRGKKKADWDRHPVFKQADGAPLVIAANETGRRTGDIYPPAQLRGAVQRRIADRGGGQSAGPAGKGIVWLPLPKRRLYL